MKRHIRQQYNKKYSLSPITISLFDDGELRHDIAKHWQQCGGYVSNPYFSYFFGNDIIMAEFLLTFQKPFIMRFIEM